MKKFISFITAIVIICANLIFAAAPAFAARSGSQWVSDATTTTQPKLRVLLSEPIGTESIKWIETKCTIVADDDPTGSEGYSVKDLKCTNSEPSNSCQENAEKKFADIKKWGLGCRTPDSSCPQDMEMQDIIYCRRVQVIEAGSGSELLQNYVGKIYKWAAGTIGIVAVLVIVVSGIELITSDVSGDVDSAKNRIMQSLAGLAILFLSAVILNTINPNFFF